MKGQIGLEIRRLKLQELLRFQNISTKLFNCKKHSRKSRLVDQIKMSGLSGFHSEFRKHKITREIQDNVILLDISKISGCCE